jgi:hypothetical protein
MPVLMEFLKQNADNRGCSYIETPNQINKKYSMVYYTVGKYIYKGSLAVDEVGLAG